MSVGEGIVSTGEIIEGRFRVDRILGRGGMGSVVLATHLRLRERVAIKFLHPDAASDEPTRQRFLREARASARLRSEHAVRIMDFGFFETGSPIIVMEYLEGSDLGTMVAKRGPLPVDEVVEYLLQASEALAEAHARGMVHRDLKPSNFFLTTAPDGLPLIKVLDFGIAKIISEIDDSFNGGVVTEAHEVLGSPAYMSPEHLCSISIDHRADLWSLGVVIYELLTGKLIFDRRSLAEIFVAILKDDPPPLRELVPEVPKSLETLALWCLRKDSADRCPDVGAFAELLVEVAPTDERRVMLGRVKRLLGASEVQAPRPEADGGSPAGALTIFRRTRERKRNRLVIRCVAAGLLATALGLGARWGAVQKDRETSRDAALPVPVEKVGLSAAAHSADRMLPPPLASSAGAAHASASAAVPSASAARAQPKAEAAMARPRLTKLPKPPPKPQAAPLPAEIPTDSQSFRSRL